MVDPPIYRTQLLLDLQHSCGMGPGEVWIVHSSMKAIGQVDGGPAAVIAAMQQAVGEQGTLLMPTFADPQPNGRFDVRSTPSRTGLITETFRTAPGVRRSLHPTHAVSAWGRLRDELLSGHERTTSLGPHSPMHKAALHGAKVLLLGCDFTVCSLIHVAEAIARVPYLGKAWYSGYDRTLTMIDEQGREYRVPPRDPPGHSSQFVKVSARMEEQGLVRRGVLGEATCFAFSAMQALTVATGLLREDPLALLCARARCSYCGAARRALGLQHAQGQSSPDETMCVR